MSITLEDVARESGVSHMTVSLVVNNKGRVSEATRRRVLDAARAIGYAPNRAAQALASGGRTQTIAVWVRRFASPFYSAVASEFERQLAGDNYEVIVRGFRVDQTILAEWPVDGIIAVDNAHTRPVTPRELQHKQTALVSVGVYVNPEVDHVTIDLTEGSRAAVRHLLKQGCVRVAHLLNEAFDIPGDSRREAYLSVMKDAAQRSEVIVFPDDTRGAVGPVLRAYIAAHGCPDGLFCRNDELAIGAYRILRDMGYRIPEDVCIVGCDGTTDTEYLDTPLSTVVTPVKEMCVCSWKFLQERMRDRTQPPMQTILHSEFQARASSLRRTSVPPVHSSPGKGLADDLFL